MGLGRKAELARGPKLGKGAGRVCGCPGWEPGLHQYSGDWEEGESEKQRRAVFARRFRYSLGVGLAKPPESGVPRGLSIDGDQGYCYCV